MCGMPLYQSLFILSTIGFGGLFYDEFPLLDNGAVVPFACGVVLVGGVVALAYFSPRGAAGSTRASGIDITDSLMGSRLGSRRPSDNDMCGGTAHQAFLDGIAPLSPVRERRHAADAGRARVALIRRAVCEHAIMSRFARHFLFAHCHENVGRARLALRRRLQRRRRAVGSQRDGCLPLDRTCPYPLDFTFGRAAEGMPRRRWGCARARRRLRCLRAERPTIFDPGACTSFGFPRQRARGRPATAGAGGGGGLLVVLADAREAGEAARLRRRLAVVEPPVDL